MQQDSSTYTIDPDDFLTVDESHSVDSVNNQDSLAVDSVVEESVFQPQLIPSILDLGPMDTGNFQPRTLPFGNEDWITVHIILILMVYAWIRLFYNKRLKQVLRSSAGIRFQGMMAREGNILRERISIALMIVYLVSTSLLVYLFFTRILNFELFQLKSFQLFSLIMLIVIFSWILKNLGNTILGKIFRNPVILSEYLLTNFVFNVATGSILLPIVILAIYLPSVDMIYIGLIVWGLAFLYRLIRLVATSISYTKFSFFNRILYLCTFELTPVIVLTKLVMSNLA